MTDHLLVRNLANTLMKGKDKWPTEFSIGKVASYDSGTGIATVEFEQTGVNVNCYVLSSYNPVADDIVAALRVGPSYIVLGSIATFIGSSAGTGGTDTFLDFTGAFTDSSITYIPWVATSGSPFVANSGNLVPDTLSGNPIARVTADGLYVIHGSIQLYTDSDTQARVAAVAVGVGSGLVKSIDAVTMVLPVGPYGFGGLSAQFTLEFVGEVNDVIFVQVTLGGGSSGGAGILATALSIT